jgi:hypothetical protein
MIILGAERSWIDANPSASQKRMLAVGLPAGSDLIFTFVFMAVVY